MTGRAEDWALLPIAASGATGAALGRGPLRLAGLWAAGWALRRLWAQVPEVASARRSARLDQEMGQALMAGRPGTLAGPGAVSAADAAGMSGARISAAPGVISASPGAPPPGAASTGPGPGASAPAAASADAERAREEDFEAQREAARDENRAVEARQHAPRGPEGIP